MSTIFGLSSAAGRAGVSVFRVSGGQCENVWNTLTLSRSLPVERMATVTRLYDPQTRQQMDECLALYFPSPRSFSGEDTLEFHIHGSLAVQEALVGVLSRLPDVRLAQPGEFTR